MILRPTIDITKYQDSNGNYTESGRREMMADTAKDYEIFSERYSEDVLSHQKLLAKINSLLSERTDNAYAEEGKDYSTSVSSEQQGRGHFAQDYLLSASFAKKLAMSSRSPKGEEARSYFIKVEEALARTAGKNLTTAEMLLQNARILVEQERRLALIEEQQMEQEEELKEIRAGLETHPVGWYTIAGYASKIGMSLDIRTAGTLGMKATRLSREWRKKIQKTPDPRFGTVNVYCPEVLEKVFEEMEDADV